MERVGWCEQGWGEDGPGDELCACASPQRLDLRISSIQLVASARAHNDATEHGQCERYLKRPLRRAPPLNSPSAPTSNLTTCNSIPLSLGSWRSSCSPANLMQCRLPGAISKLTPPPPRLDAPVFKPPLPIPATLSLDAPDQVLARYSQPSVPPRKDRPGVEVPLALPG